MNTDLEMRMRKLETIVALRNQTIFTLNIFKFFMPL